jgi:DNA gyrase subunit A
LKDEIDALKIRIKEIEDILDDEKKVLEIIKLELHEVKARIKSPRRSNLTSDDLGIKGMEDLVKKDNVVVTLTRDNYIRRVSLSDYTVQARARKGKIGAPTKDEDVIIDSFIMSTHDLMLMFTTTGRVYKLKAWDIPGTDRKSKGTPIVNILPLAEDEKIFRIISIKEFDDQRYVIFATMNGKIKATNLSLFKNVKSLGIHAIQFNEGDSLLDVYLSHEFGEDVTAEKFILMTSTDNKAIRFPIKEIPERKRVAKGVIGMKLRDGNKCSSMAVVGKDDEVLVLTSDGWGKRTEAMGFPMHKRNTMGTLCMNKYTDKGGELFGAYRVREEDEVLLISKKGKVIRIMAKEIKKMLRVRLGVKLLNMKDDDHIVSATVRSMSME